MAWTDAEKHAALTLADREFSVAQILQIFGHLPGFDGDRALPSARTSIYMFKRARREGSLDGAVLSAALPLLPENSGELGAFLTSDPTTIPPADSAAEDNLAAETDGALALTQEPTTPHPPSPIYPATPGEQASMMYRLVTMTPEELEDPLPRLMEESYVRRLEADARRISGYDAAYIDSALYEAAAAQGERPELKALEKIAKRAHPTANPFRVEIWAFPGSRNKRRELRVVLPVRVEDTAEHANTSLRGTLYEGLLTVMSRMQRFKASGNDQSFHGFCRRDFDLGQRDPSYGAISSDITQFVAKYHPPLTVLMTERSRGACFPGLQ